MTAGLRVPVDLGERGYDVVVGDGVRRELAAVVAAAVPEARRAALVTQGPLTELDWWKDVDPGLPVDLHLVGEGEGAKSLSTVEALCRSFARSELSRRDVVVAVGGGVVTDVGGFAASVYHRGVAWCALSTSLLGQVDAAVGGKTGVNLVEGKNLVGSFWQPSVVICDTGVLRTLPARELASGRGELAKYAFLGEPDLAGRPLADQVARAVALKAAAVAGDEREDGRRMLLNYGHTLAHALEAAAFDDGGLRHGEAVAVGLVYASLLARRLGRVGEERVVEHRRVVAAMGLSDALPTGTDPAALVAYMRRDKKATHGLTFVLEGPNGVEPVAGVPEPDVLAALADLAALEPLAPLDPAGEPAR